MSRTARKPLGKKKLEQKKSRKLQALKRTYPLGSLIQWDYRTSWIENHCELEERIGIVIGYKRDSELTILFNGDICIVHRNKVLSVNRLYEKV